MDRKLPVPVLKFFLLEDKISEVSPESKSGGCILNCVGGVADFMHFIYVKKAI
jgi:hypothetical protein